MFYIVQESGSVTLPASSVSFFYCEMIVVVVFINICVY